MKLFLETERSAVLSIDNSFQQSQPPAYLIPSAKMCSNQSEVEEDFVIGDGALNEKELSNDDGDSDFDELIK